MSRSPLGRGPLAELPKEAVGCRQGKAVFCLLLCGAFRPRWPSWCRNGDALSCPWAPQWWERVGCRAPHEDLKPTAEVVCGRGYLVDEQPWLAIGLVAEAAAIRGNDAGGRGLARMGRSNAGDGHASLGAAAYQDLFMKRGVWVAPGSRGDRLVGEDRPMRMEYDLGTMADHPTQGIAGPP